MVALAYNFSRRGWRQEDHSLQAYIERSCHKNKTKLNNNKSSASWLGRALV